MTFTSNFFKSLVAAGVDVREISEPRNRRVVIVHEGDGTVTEIPVIDFIDLVDDYVTIFEKSRGTTLVQREAQRASGERL